MMVWIGHFLTVVLFARLSKRNSNFTHVLFLYASSVSTAISVLM
jgi:hypothetical protein